MAARRQRVRSSITPSAARLTESLRDIGYDFPTAVADLVDNSIAAGACRVDVLIEFRGAESVVFIADDGEGMTENQLVEALRFGSRRDYAHDDLGRYGLGLKTASLSQCRSVTVVTRRAAHQRRIVVRELDLDFILRWDQWLVLDPGSTGAVERACGWLDEGPGTVVIWQRLDRVLPEVKPEGGWARRRLEQLARRTAEHLGVVFHRYLEGLPDGRCVSLTVNGDKVAPWNPFAPDEPSRVELPAHVYELSVGDLVGAVRLRRVVLPPRDQFSSPDEFERLSGPLKWNRQQGLYVYRADRLVQFGGWNGIRAIDEHTKLARAAVDFDTDLDTVFNINVAKMHVSVPPQLRQMIERPLHELCIRADDVYRKTSRSATEAPQRPPPVSRQSSAGVSEIALALQSAALTAGELPALRRIGQILRQTAPHIAEALGLQATSDPREKP